MSSFSSFENTSLENSSVAAIPVDRIPEAIAYIQQKLLGFNFAFTGGAALYLWAREFNQAFDRPLKDIDIVTNESLIRFKSFVDTPSVPGPEARHISGKIGHLNIDVITSGRGFGNMQGSVTLKDGQRVVSLYSLKNYKYYQVDDEGGRQNISEKHTKDLKLIETLFSLQKAKEKQQVKEPTEKNSKDTTIFSQEDKKRKALGIFGEGPAYYPLLSKKNKDSSRRLEF